MIIDLSNPAHLFIAASVITALMILAMLAVQNSEEFWCAVPIVMTFLTLIGCFLYSLFQLIIKSL